MSEEKGWQPIETAPKGEYVLVFCPDASPVDQIMICGLLEFIGDPDPPDWWPHDTRKFGGQPLDVVPTHWRRLPDPPP